MATIPSPNPAPVPTSSSIQTLPQVHDVGHRVAAMLSPEGQPAGPASEHGSLRSSVKEEPATGDEDLTRPSRRYSDRRVRSPSRYEYHELEHNRGIPSELKVTPDQPEYFETLVAKTLETESLATVRPVGHWEVAKSSPLYPLTPGQPRVTSEDLNGDHGTTLAFDLALRLQTYHAKAQIKKEMAKVVTDGSTSTADLDRMRDLLSQLSSYSKLRNALRYSYGDVIQQRLAAGDLFPEDPELLMRTPPSSRSRSRSRSNGGKEDDGERSQKPKRPHVAFVEGIRSILVPSNASRRDPSIRRSGEVREDPLSASEHGEAPAPDTAADEKKPGKRKRVLDIMVNIGLGIVLIIVFIPMLVYEFFKKMGGEDTDGGQRKNESKFSRRESFMRRDRRHRYDRKKGFPTRLLAAFVGGLSLVVPMLIMSLDPSLTKSLITTSVFIFVFGVMLAWTTSMEPPGVLTATATYAAVLVVFTGVSN